MATLTLSIKRLPAPFGAEILGVNLAEPLDSATFA